MQTSFPSLCHWCCPREKQRGRYSLAPAMLQLISTSEWTGVMCNKVSCSRLQHTAQSGDWTHNFMIVSLIVWPPSHAPSPNVTVKDWTMMTRSVPQLGTRPKGKDQFTSDRILHTRSHYQRLTDCFWSNEHQCFTQHYCSTESEIGVTHTFGMNKKNQWISELLSPSTEYKNILHHLVKLKLGEKKKN